MNVCPTATDDVDFGSWAVRRVSWLEPDFLKAETPDDVALIRQVAQGDRQAFAQLYDRYATILFSTAVRVLNDTKEAEDVLQEVFLLIWDKARYYDSGQGKPFNWVVTLTRNKAIDRLRSAQRRFRLVNDAAEKAVDTTGSQPGPRDEIYRSEQSVIVRSAVTELPVEQRQAIEMAFFWGMTQQEISQSLGEPLGTVKARIRRGLLKLRDALGGCL